MHAMRKRQQRANHASPDTEPDGAASVDFVALVGSVLGSMRRQYGLLACDEGIHVASVVERCSDLAVADRVAWIYACQDHSQYVVFEYDGWFWVGTPASTIPPDQLLQITPGSAHIRLLSVATERGIMPLVGAAAAVAS